MDFALQLLAMAVACYGSYRLGYGVACGKFVPRMERVEKERLLKEAQEAL